MEIKKAASAGTLESSDIMITLEPRESGIEIDLQSIVENRFGKEIRALIRDTLLKYGIKNVTVIAVDQGALDLVIRARVKTAVGRACETEIPVWE